MQRTLPSRLFSLLLVLIAIAAVWFLAAFFQYRHERNLAKAAIQTVGELQVGYTAQGQAEVMLTPYTKYRVQGLANAVELAFVNRRWLEPFRSPSQWIYITVEFRDGTVSSRSFQFLDQPRRRAAITQRILLSAEKLHLGGTFGHRKIITAGDQSSPYFVTDIREDLEVPDEQRSRDWQFNLDCFKFMTSCKDVRGVLEGAHPQ